MKKKTVLVITNQKPNFAEQINSNQRIQVIQKLGLDVQLISKKNRIEYLIRKVKNSDYLYLRIDGSGILDKYTLLKLFNWKCQVIWEVHGSQKEKVLHSTSKLKFLIEKKDRYKRNLLSFFVTSYIFISKELKDFSFKTKELTKKTSFIIPNFADINQEKNKLHDYFKKNIFKVLWVGNPYFKWHGLDIIESVAKKIYSLDKNIIFIITGGTGWHTFSWISNLLIIEPFSKDKLQEYIRTCDVGLAIYKKNKLFPNYFSPLKILDYLKEGLPVIATKTKTINSIINGKNGILTNNSVDEIVNQIIKLKNDKLLSRKISTEAKKTIRNNFNSKNALKKYKKVFE